MTVTRAALLGLLHLLLPAPCLGCGAVPAEARAWLGLCTRCRGLLRRPQAGCGRCGRPLAVAAEVCGRCLTRPPAFDRLVAAWRYEPPLEAVIRGLKFGRLDYLGRHLARGLAPLVAAQAEPLDGVVPVPLHWRRRLLRGYDQAVCIAAPLGRRLGAPLCRALRRPRATAPQASLSRAGRLANPHLAFRVRMGTRLAGKSLLLVDDVATTGATLGAAAAALKAAGAHRVVAVAAALTPEEPRSG